MSVLVLVIWAFGVTIISAISWFLFLRKLIKGRK
jgi:hypothetical protein